MRKDRSGRVKVSSLLFVLGLAAFGYYGYVIGGVYFRRLKLDGAVQQYASFAGQLTDEAIRQKVVDEVNAMHLPPAARRVRLVRVQRPRAIRISIAYSEPVNLLFTTKKMPVSIEVHRAF